MRPPISHALVPALLLLAVGCDQFLATRSASPQPASAATRLGRRASVGAPPVIPHPPDSADCGTCHNARGTVVPGLGVAPANPHLKTPGLSAGARCRQCHLFVQTTEVFRPSEFTGSGPSARRGDRATRGAPPTIPHPQFLREDCDSCHSGPAARPEIVCRHTNRPNCAQCHVRSASEDTAPLAKLPSTNASEAD